MDVGLRGEALFLDGTAPWTTRRENFIFSCAGVGVEFIRRVRLRGFEARQKRRLRYVRAPLGPVRQRRQNAAGSGARDSIRPEAGPRLHGRDLNGAIDPVEAASAWDTGGSKGRRRGEGGFLGAERIPKPLFHYYCATPFFLTAENTSHS